MLTEKKITYDQVIHEKERFQKEYGIMGKNNTVFLSDIAITETINLASKDLMVRTLKKKSGMPRISEIDFKDFANMIKEYFSDNKKDKDSFDKWHHDACSSVLDLLKKSYSNVGYGKAQKLVNMTFKYMYCHADAKDFEEYFQYCHMPLDSFTLEWIKREAKDIKSGKIPSWSNLQYADDEGHKIIETINGKYTYNFLVKTIRDLIKEKADTDITPLQAEFVIWPQIQLKQAAEAFLFQLQSHNDEELSNSIRKDIREQTLDENLKDIKNKIDL